MAIKKSELYSSLWASCDELRGGMDASQYKDYVLVLLFIKYISDKFANVRYAPIAIPKGASFKDMVVLKGTPNIGEDINRKIIGPIADVNNLHGTIDVADFNNPDKLGSGKEMVDRLTNLIAIFENPALDFTKNRAEGDDLLGDAYEYLMRNFATESGKSKGQFYTPAEVSRVMAKVIGVNSSSKSSTTVYDPTCGSGSLLLKVANEAESGISLYGQERDTATSGLARMNLVLHGHSIDIQEIKKGNTLSNPLHLDDANNLKIFDFVVANPPFSDKAWSSGFAIQDGTISDIHDRFKDYGIPPRKNGDYAFLLHIIRSLKRKGKGAVILPHGVLFRGNVEAEIRENIIKRGYIKGIIGLPPNLFYGTGIPACIIVLDKEDAENRKSIFMIDASKGFIKDGNKNRLREQDIHKIVDVFNKRLEIEKYSRLIPLEKIENNEYNLNIPRYIDSQEPEDIQDIEAHLLGGIPNADLDALQNYWQVCPSLRSVLFKKAERPNYSDLKISVDQIRETIFKHPEFIEYGYKVNRAFDHWKKNNLNKMKSVAVGDKAKQFIFIISEDLLTCFSDLPLIDKYDVYQNLMIYWMEIMQDDVYAIVNEGWEVGREIEKGSRKNEWDGRLIPKELMIAQYFNKEQKKIDGLKSELEKTEAQIEKMVDDNSGEEGFLEMVKNVQGKVTKGNAQQRVLELKDDILNSHDTTEEQIQLVNKIKKDFTKTEWQKGIQDENDFFKELDVLYNYLLLIDQQSDLKSKIKKANSELEKELLSKYKILSVQEVKNLVVDEKWLTRMKQDVQNEMQRISQRLTGRIKELADRYEKPLPEVNRDVYDYEKKVNDHLKKMGFIWK